MKEYVVSDTPGRLDRWKAKRAVAGELDIAPLKARLDNGSNALYEADQKLDEIRIKAVLHKKKLWSMPQGDQVVARNWWLALVLWHAAKQYFEGIMADRDDKFHLPPHTYQMCLQLCDNAETWTTQAIGDASQVDLGLPVQISAPEALPDFDVTPESYKAVWQSLACVYQRFMDIQAQIVKDKIPERFQRVFREIVAPAERSSAVFEHLRDSWWTTHSAELQFDLTRRAVQPANELFVAGQLFLAPHLVGEVYQECLSAPFTAEELDLGFDPWIITDSDVKQKFEQSGEKEAVETSLREHWAEQPDPQAAFRLSQQVAQARSERLIRHVNGEALAYCPWSACWLAVKPVTLGSVELQPGDKFLIYSGRVAGGKSLTEIRKVGQMKLEFSLSPKQRRTKNR